MSHVNACDGGPSDDAVNDPVGEVLDQARRASEFDHLFLVRFHSSIATLGEPSAEGGWPSPDIAFAHTTPSTRAIVLRDGPWYTLRAGDADVVHTTPGGAKVYLGSEAAARDVEWLRTHRVTAIINCAYNSDPLDESSLAAAGVARVQRVRMVDAAKVAGQDAAGMIKTGAAEVANGVQDCSPGESVLIHCVAGVSRSAAVAIGYLVLHTGARLIDAATAVRAVRPVAFPNLGFWHALVALEAGVVIGGEPSVPPQVIDDLHPHSQFPMSTHIFGAKERS